MKRNVEGDYTVSSSLGIFQLLWISPFSSRYPSQSFFTPPSSPLPPFMMKIHRKVISKNTPGSFFRVGFIVEISSFDGYRLGRLEVECIRYNYGIMSVWAWYRSREKLGSVVSCATLCRLRNTMRRYFGVNYFRRKHVRNQSWETVTDFFSSIPIWFLDRKRSISRHRTFPWIDDVAPLIFASSLGLISRYRLIAQTISSMCVVHDAQILWQGFVSIFPLFFLWNSLPSRPVT